MNEHTVRADSGALWFDVVLGAKTRVPPILCLHGGLGLDHSTIGPFLESLAAHSSAVVQYDHIGNGRSAEPANWLAIDHGTMADDVDSVRQRLVDDGLPAQRTIIVGHSYGGFIAMEYALRYPERIAGLILCSTAPAFQHADLLVANARARSSDERFAGVLALLAAPALDDESLANGMRSIAPLYFHRSTTALCHTVFGDVQFRASAFNHSISVLAPAYDLRGHLGSVAMAAFPVLLVGGADDWIMPTSVGLDVLAAEMPRATRVEIPESGHFTFAEQPSAFMNAVTPWLEINHTGLAT